jgi:hypothetical protein
VAVRRDAVPRARAFLLEALTLAEGMGSRSLGQAVLSIGFLIETTAGAFVQAARCHGAWLSECERQGLDIHLDDELQAPAVERARTALGAEPFRAAEVDGQHLDYAAALGELRHWLAAR